MYKLQAMKEFVLMGLSRILKDNVEYTKDDIKELVHRLLETEVQLHLYCKLAKKDINKETIDKFFAKVYKDY